VIGDLSRYLKREAQDKKGIENTFDPEGKQALVFASSLSLYGETISPYAMVSGTGSAKFLRLRRLFASFNQNIYERSRTLLPHHLCP
jgi:hypothetical protein